MSAARQTLDLLDREHAALGRLLALRWPHWLALGLSVVVSILSWQVAARFVAERAETRYEHEASTIADALVYRLERLARDGAAAAGPGEPILSAGTVESLMTGILDPQRRLVGLSLHAPDGTIYRDGPVSGAAHASARLVPRVDGDDWTLRLWSTPELERRARGYLPYAVLTGGLAIDGLLFVLFLTQGRGARRTLHHAKSASILSTDLDRTATELKQVNGELERFAHVVSHDLKAPVQGVAGLLDILAMDVDEECGPDVQVLLGPTIAKARRRTSDMESLIGSILTSSALAAGTREDEVDLGDLVRSIGQALAIDADRLVVADDMPTIHTDCTRLYQVLTNLIQNAFRYHDDPATARVVVSASVVGDMVRLKVSDNGPGIARENHARVFEPFESLAENARPGSTGIGLSIVKEAVEAVGGVLKLDSKVGVGASFEFTWPA